LNPKKDIVLKKCLIDELGVERFTAINFNPNYSYYRTNTNLFILVDAPDLKPGTTKCDKKIDEEYTIISVTGEKKGKIDQKDCTRIFGENRESGRFDINLKIKTGEIGNIKFTKFEYLNGVMVLTYLILEEESVVSLF